MAFNIRKRNTGETGAATTPASAPRASAPVTEDENDKRRGFNIRKAEAAVPVSRAAATPANNGYAPARNVLDDLDRQNELYRLALETERADELDKSNAPSASRQAAQRAQKNQHSGKYNGVDRQALARGAGQALKESVKAAGDLGADLVDSFISGGGNSAWGGTVFGTLTALDEATGNAMNKVLGKITGDEKYNEPFVSPFREYAEYHSGQAADTLQRVTEDKSWLRQQVMKAGSAAGNMLFSSSLASLGAGSGVGMGAQFSGTQAGLGASAAQRATSAITGAAARLGNEIIANPGNALISLGSGGSTYIDATNRGAEQGGALMNAVGAGLLEYMSNKLFGGMPIENAGDEQGYVMMLAQKVVERLGKSEAMQNFLNTTGGQAVTWIVDKLGEGLEEVVTEFFDPMIERLTWNPEAALATMDEIADAFAGGVALSLLMSGGEALIDNTGKALSPPAAQDEEAQRMEALVRLAQQMEETAAAEEAAPAEQPIEQPVKAPIEQPITPPVEPTQEIKPTMPTTQPTLAQAERTEPPAGNLTPEETKGAEAQETPSPATQQRTEAETEKPKAGIYRAEKTGLPYDIVVEQIPTQQTTDTKSETPLQDKPQRGTISTKKSDWTAHDVEWTVPGKKKPIAYSTTATSDSIGVMADEHPDASISDLVQYFHYGPDEKKVLQQYINAGYGSQNAREWFSYDARHGVRPTAPYNKQGVKSWEDMIDSGRVSSMTKGELNAVKDIFEKPKTEDKKEDVANGGDNAGVDKGRENIRGGDTGQRRLPTAGHKPEAEGSVPDDSIRGAAGVQPHEGSAGEAGTRSGRSNDSVRSEPRGDAGSAGQGDGQTVPGVADGDRGIAEPGRLGGANESGGAVVSKPKAKNRKNYRIAEDIDSKRPNFNDNVSAIKLLKNLMESGRKPTAEEMATLAKFKGWGGLKDILVEGSYYNRQLKGILTPEEMNAAKLSTLNAHYTSTKVISAMYDAVKRLGFNGGRVLEPSMGVGNFFGAMPDKLSRASDLYGVELDSITGNIAKLLYPDAKIDVAGFQDVLYPDDTFDLVIGNVPFSNDIKIPYRNTTYNLHDFFFVKALDETRPGGIVALITSTGTLDKISGKTQKSIADRANLIAAFRLPDDAFKTNAGTEVTTDLIFLQKKGGGIEDNGVEFQKIGEIDGIPINEYYVSHPKNILGTLSREKNMYARERTVVHGTGDDMQTVLSKAIKTLPKDIMSGGIAAAKPVTVRKRGQRSKASFTANADGSVTITDSSTGEVVEYGNATKAEKEKAQTIKDYIGLKNTFLDLLETEARGDNGSALRDKLNTQYDDFKKNHGALTSKDNKKLLSPDGDYIRTTGLEVKSKDGVEKSDIFRVPTVSKTRKTHADTAEEALSVSLNESGRIDLDRMAELTGDTQEQLLKALEDEIIQTPDGDYQLVAQYASGNIYQKLDQIKGRPGFERQRKLLESALPRPKTAAEIDATFGAHWIAPEYVRDFIRELFETNATVNFSRELGKWDIQMGFSGVRRFSTDRVSAKEIVENTLNGKNIEVKDKLSDGSKVLNEAETKLAQAKQDDLREAFRNWAFKDKSRAKALIDTFNRSLNAYAPMNYDALADRIDFGVNPASRKQPRPYQKAAAARIVFGGNTLLHNGVGTGKTLTMIIAAHAMKQAGIAQKPMLVVPNGKVEDFRSEILEAYPDAKILALDNDAMTPKQIQSTKAMIATGDWDYVIVFRTAFQRLPLSPETEAQMLQRQLDLYEDAARDMAGDRNGNKRFEKGLQARIETLKNRIQKVLDKQKDDSVYFDDMGIDALFIDEAHNYKKVGFPTTFQFSGIVADTNDITTDLYMKEEYLRDRGDRIVLATATPITNAISEMYNMAMHVAPEVYRDAGIYSFDTWANTFVNIESQPEIASDGKTYRRKERARNFKNANALFALYRQFADIKQTKDYVEGLPEAEYVIVKSEGTGLHKHILSYLSSLPADKTLQMNNDGKAAASDLRLVTDLLSEMGLDMTAEELDLPGSKINKAVAAIVDEYQKSSDIRGTQFVFLDSGVNSSGTRYHYNLYDDLVKKLVKSGIPKSEIAKIGDYDGEDKRQILYDKMNNGEIRVLIGSTAKMGEGVNAQQRAVALHHLSVPYRPDNLEQREGRIVRSGNMNKNVRIYKYIQEESYDSYLWQMIERKAAYLAEAYNGGDATEVDELSDAQVSAREAKAIATGNPLIMEKMNLQDKISRLRILYRGWQGEQYDAPRDIERYRTFIRDASSSAKNAEADMKTYQAAVEKAGDKFTITIGNKTFDNRKDAAEALGKALANGRGGKIGTVYGLEFGTKLDYNVNRFMFYVRGKEEYNNSIGDSPAGNLTRIVNLAEKGPISAKANAERSIKNYEAAIRDAQQTLKTPFKQKEELEQAQARMREIDRELGITDSAEIVNDATNGADGVEESDVDFFKESDADTIRFLENQKHVTVYRAMQVIDGKLYPPMAAKVKGDGGKTSLVEPTEIGVWYRSDERPDLVKNGKFTLSKGNGKSIAAAYNPYFHTSASPLNDQFSSAYDRPNLVVVECEIPSSELTSGYHAEGAKNSVGETQWHSGPVAGKLKGDKARRVFLSRWVKVKRIVPDAEVASIVAKTLEGEDIAVPTNVVTPSLLAELRKQNVKIEEIPGKGGAERELFYKEPSPHPERWEAERINGGSQTSVKGVSEILEQIRHDFNVNITAGHVRGAGRLGLYTRSNRGIRIKHSNDMPIATHELGHHLDNVYGLRDGMTAEIANELVNGLTDEQRDTYKKKSQQITEGIAEYFRKYLQNRETAVIDYPAFTAYWKGLITGRDAALIDQLADEVNAYYALDADTATSSIRSRSEAAPDARTFGEKIRDKYDALYQQWADSNHGIKRFTEEAGDNKAYIMATNAAYRDAVAGAIITGDLRDADGRYVSPGLGTVLHGVNLKSKSEYRLFGEYLAVKHGPERLAEGMRIFADDRKNSTAWMKQRQEQLEEQHPEFEAASERLYQFIGDLYQTWGVDTGLIGEDTLKEWRERWQYYVPLNRAVPVEARGRGVRRGFANQNSTVKRAHGSGLDIINPVDNLIDNLVRLVNAGTLNNVMRTLTDAADQYGVDASFLERVPVPLVKQFFNAVGLKKNLANTFMDSNMSAEDKATALDTIGNIDDLLEQYKKGKAHGDVVTVMKHGEQEFWKINDPLLLQSLTNLTPQKQGAVVEAYAHITRFMTSAITGKDVIWGLFSNFPRDLQTLMTYTGERNKLKLLAAIGESYVNKFKGNDADPLYLEYLAMGGGQGLSAYTADRNLADKARRKLSGDKLQWFNPLEWLAYISDTIESGPRYATYKTCREKGMTPQEAIYAAHDITVNFRKAGVESRTLNKFIPYFNAGVQGLDKYARWLGAEDAPKNERSRTAARRALMYLAVNAALGTLFYALNNRDDEDRENYQQLSNYTKNSYWLFPLGDGKYFAIPKARELSVPASLFETIAERVHGGNKHAFDEFWSYAADMHLPPVISDLASMPESGIERAGYGAMSSFGIAGVGGSILANRDYLGKPIVSAGMQYYEPRDQYNERTSKLAKTLGEGLNYSPQKIDYALQQSLGGYWKYQKALFPVGSENADLTLGIQNRYIKDNQYSTDLINWLFDKAEASAAAKKSDPADTGKAVTAAMDSRMTDFYSRYYKLAKNTTEAQRGTRQTVLNMIKEYQKDADNGFVSPTLRMVYDVCEREGDTEFLPSTMQSSIKDGNKADHLLSDVQYVEYQTDYLRRYYEYVETALPAAKNDREETAILRAAKSYAKDTATDAALKRIGAPTGDTVDKYGSVSEDKVIQFKAALDLADDDGGLSQQEVIDAIDALRLSRSQSSTLFHTRYDSDKNNPYKR